VTSGWLPQGAGRAVFQIFGGDVGPSKPDGGEECWDAALRVVYGREVWDTDNNGAIETVGDPADCALAGPCRAVMARTRDTPGELRG
jgi:hypothetical protein